MAPRPTVPLLTELVQEISWVVCRTLNQFSFQGIKRKICQGRKAGGSQTKNESWRSVIYTTDGEGRPLVQHGPSKAAGWGRGCQGGGPLQGPGQGMLQPRAPVLLNPNG